MKEEEIKLPGDASARPIDPLTNKPLATEKEVNKAAHLAGQQAAEAKRADPGQDEARALLSGACNSRGEMPVKCIGGVDVYPLSMGIYYVLEAIGSTYLQEGDGRPKAVSIDDLVYAAFAFCHPEWSYETLVEREATIEFEKRAKRFALNIGRADLGALNEYINEQFREFGLAAKKEEAEPEKTTASEDATTSTPSPDSAGTPRSATGGQP